MQTPFIHNHQFNYIQKQADFLLKTLRSVVDPKVLDTVRYTVSTNAVGIFNDLTPEQKQLLEQLSTYEKTHELQTYLNQLEAYLIPFPQVSAKQIQKLFPKVKKLKGAGSGIHRLRTYNLSEMDRHCYRSLVHRVSA